MDLLTGLLLAISNDFTTDPETGLLRRIIEPASGWPFADSTVFAGFFYGTLLGIMLIGVVIYSMHKDRCKRLPDVNTKVPLTKVPLWITLSIVIPLVFLFCIQLSQYRTTGVVIPTFREFWVGIPYVARFLVGYVFIALFLFFIPFELLVSRRTKSRIKKSELLIEDGNFEEAEQCCRKGVELCSHFSFRELQMTSFAAPIGQVLSLLDEHGVDEDDPSPESYYSNAAVKVIFNDLGKSDDCDMLMKGKIDRHLRAKTVLVINHLLRQEISKNTSELFGVFLFLTLFSMVLLMDVIPWSLLAPMGSYVSIGITSGVLVFGIIHYRLHNRNYRSANEQFIEAGWQNEDEWEGGAGSSTYIPEFAKAMVAPVWIKMLLTISILVLAAGLLTRFPVLTELLMRTIGWISGFMLVVIVAIALIVGFYGFMEYLFRESRIVKSVVGILIVSSLVGLAFIQNVPLIVRISAGVLVLTVLPFLVFWLYRAIEMRRLISNSKQYRECMKAGMFNGAFVHLKMAHSASCKYFDRIQSHVIFGEILEKQGKLDWANHFYRIAMSEGDTLEGGDLLSQHEHQLLRKALTVEVLTSDPADLDSTVEDSSNESEDDTVDISVDASVDTDVDPRRIRLLIKRIMEEASLRKVSHVYFEAEEDQLVLRYRVDGVCHIRDWMPKRLQKDLVDTLKYMAGVNLAVHNIPQHGVFVRTTDQKPTVVHLTTIPGEHGESIMLSMSSGPKCTLKGKALKDEGKRLDIPGAAKMKADDLRAAVALHL